MEQVPVSTIEALLCFSNVTVALQAIFSRFFRHHHEKEKEKLVHGGVTGETSLGGLGLILLPKAVSVH